MRYIKYFESVDNLFDAIRALSIRRITVLLKDGADVNIQNKIGRTTLINACKVMNVPQDQIIKVVRLLVEFGAKLDLQDINGNTALISAAQLGKEKVVHELIELGADWAIENKEKKDFLNFFGETFLDSELKYVYPEKYKEYLFKKDAKKYNL